MTLFFCLFAGCVSSDFMPVGAVTFPPRPNDYIIDVYLESEAPVKVHKAIANAKPLASLPRGAFEIGRVDTIGSPDASWGQMVNDAKKKARTLGGDAIVLKGWGNQLAGVDGYGQAYHGKSIAMSVMRYK